MLVRLMVVVVLVAVTGCASTRYSEFSYITPGATVFQWPAPPNEPRYRYIGDLHGETNFKEAGEKSIGDWLSDIFNWAIGAFSDKYVPDMLERPQTGVVDDEGKVYVTDVARQSVYVFDEDGGDFARWRFFDEERSFLTPIGITFSTANQRLYVSDADLAAIVVLDKRGQYQGVIGKGVLSRPTGVVWSDEEQLLFVVDTHAHDVKIFSREGELFGQFGIRGHGEGELNSPTHIAYANKRLYVSDTLNARIQVFDVDGAYQSTFGKRGVYLGDTPRPKGVALDSSGNVYIVESFYDHLLVFNSSGELLLPIGGPGAMPGQFFLPAGVWIDSQDRIYVADMFNRRVSVFQYITDQAAP